MLVRASLLISRFGIQKKLLENGKAEDFTKFQKFFSVKNSILLFSISVLVIFFIYLGVTLSYNDVKTYYALESIPIHQCTSELLGRVIVGFFIIYNTSFVIAAIVMHRQRVRETLGFKTELCLNAIVQFIVPMFIYGGSAIKDAGLIYL